MAILAASIATSEAEDHGTAALTWRASTSRVQLYAISLEPLGVSTVCSPRVENP
jgi:hypothetical protein